jgi:hypothetical protein
MRILFIVALALLVFAAQAANIRSTQALRSYRDAMLRGPLAPDACLSRAAPAARQLATQ